VSFGGKPDIGFGLLLIVIVFFAQDGLAGLVRRGTARYRLLRTRFNVEGTAAAQAPTATPSEALEEVPVGERDHIRT